MSTRSRSAPRRGDRRHQLLPAPPPVPRAAGKIKAPTLVIWAVDDFALGIELTRGMDGLFERKPRIE